MSTSQLQLAYYADDFTGATDALEQLSLGGVATSLLLAPPSPGDSTLEGFQAVGVAGHSRSLPTESIAEAVGPALERLRDLGPRHVHYKVCSTFDSSPQIGSIGRVIEVASQIFDAPFIPVVAGAPALGRWCVFGNLFASYGVGEATPAYRLDRHPSASRHPITPASEADLRRILSEQTTKRIELIDVRTLDLTTDEAITAVEATLARTRADVLVFDCLSQQHLRTIGDVLEHYAMQCGTLFTVGSSGVETALASLWGAPSSDRPAKADINIDGPVLVLSGSCSPVTREQLEHAAASGLEVLALRPNHSAEAEDVAERAASALATGRSVAVASTDGTQDLRPDVKLDSAELGAALADVWRRCRQRGPIGLTVVAGGDTSSYVARALGVASLTMVAPFAKGAPICRLRSDDPLVDGALFVFKGGQVGGPRLLADLVPSNSPRAS